MKIDGGIGVYAGTGDLDSGEVAKAQEDRGYDGLWAAETSHDPFISLALAARATERVELGTGIVVAFGRNPMDLAVTANDLQLVSKGRFILGLGSQIKPHIEKRFSMPWSHPAPRMREFILAMRAIWDAWHNGTKLDFRGDFYTHTLMTPFFNPGPNPYGLPRIFLGGVGPRMTEVAGEVADGFMIHPFSTRAFIEQTTMPALQRGLDRAGRTRADIQIAFPIMVVAADTDDELARGVDGMRARLAFYGSTPAYKRVLDTHGWGDLQPELNTLSKRGAWPEMSALITDGMVDELCIVGKPAEIPEKLLARYGDIVDRASFDTGKPDNALIGDMARCALNKKPRR